MVVMSSLILRTDEAWTVADRDDLQPANDSPTVNNGHHRPLLPVFPYRARYQVHVLYMYAVLRLNVQ